MSPRTSKTHRRTAARRGFAFLKHYALEHECWTQFAPDVQYMFLHLATRPRQPELSHEALALAAVAARRWCAESPRLPPEARPGELLLWYAYGAYTPTVLGLDTRAMRRDLAQALRRHSVRDCLGFDPRIDAPPAPAVRAFRAWQRVLVGTHLAAVLGLELPCSVRDAVAWRDSLLPYPDARRRLTAVAWQAFYAVTHLVYVLNDYSLHALSRRRFEPEIDFIREVCEHGIRGGDVEILGESLDVLLALGEDPSGLLVEDARKGLLELQNADGSWGARDDPTYSRFHKTWVALDGLADYGTRKVLRLRLPRGFTS